jgi:hypothetical protein
MLRKANDEACKTPRHGAVSLASSIRSSLSRKSKEFIMITDTKVTDRGVLVFSRRGCLVAHRNSRPNARIMARCKITFYCVSAKFQKLFCRGPGELILLDLFLRLRQKTSADIDESESRW